MRVVPLQWARPEDTVMQWLTPTANTVKDTVGDFDDMANAFPQRSQVSFVSQADLVTLHQPHIWNWKRHKLERLLRLKWLTDKLRRRNYTVDHGDIVIWYRAPTKQLKTPLQTQARTKQAHMPQKDAGEGRSHAILQSEGQWGCALSTAQNHRADVKFKVTTWIRLGQCKIGNPLFIQSQVPPDRYIVLGLQKENKKIYIQ